MGLQMWLIICGILLAIEIITQGLTSIWFAGGALVAGIVAKLGGSWLIQILIFAGVSLLLFAFTRPVVSKHLIKKTEKTNADSLIGDVGVVVQTIDNTKSEGVVKIRGMEWTARSIDDKEIEEGEKVVIESISGVKLMVRKKED